MNLYFGFCSCKIDNKTLFKFCNQIVCYIRQGQEYYDCMLHTEVGRQKCNYKTKTAVIWSLRK